MHIDLRRKQIVLGGLVLVLGLLACNLPSSDQSAPAAVQTAAAATASAATAATADAAFAADPGMCPAVVPTPAPSGLVSGVTMAEDTSGEEREPVNPTSVYTPSSTFHAVVAIKDAPADTRFKAVWYAVDTAGVVACDSEIEVIELVTDGTRNVDFSLTPESLWPAGDYRVEIYTNDVLDQTVDFAVQ